MDVFIKLRHVQWWIRIEALQNVCLLRRCGIHLSYNPRAVLVMPSRPPNEYAFKNEIKAAKRGMNLIAIHFYEDQLIWNRKMISK